MKLEDLAEEFGQTRPWLVISPDEVLTLLVQATRFYAGYGEIASLSAAAQPQSAPGAGLPLPQSPEPAPVLAPTLPVRNLKLIKESTLLTAGEWAVVLPLFSLYVERENAMRLEATRASGIDPYGRSSSEVSADIRMEEENLPAKAFTFAPISV